MKVFSQLMEIYGVEHYRAWITTSAMRDAKNGKEIIDLVKKESGIQIEIISGDEEAALIYENHVAEGLDKILDILYRCWWWFYRIDILRKWQNEIRTFFQYWYN